MSYEQLAQHVKDLRIEATRAQMTYIHRCGSTSHWENIYKNYEFIEPVFDPFLRMPDPAVYDPSIQQLGDAMAKLNNRTSTIHTDLSKDVQILGGNLDHLETAGGYLDDWTGEAAIAFKANYIDRFRTIAGNHFTMLSTMRGALQAHQAMWLAARKDIDKIAHNTLDALQNYQEPTKNDWKFPFSVLAAVGTVAAAAITIVTGGATAPVVGIGSAASVGNAAITYEAKVGGATPDTIIASMQKEIDSLRDHIQHVESVQIEERLWRLQDAVYQNRDSLVAARPKLADMSDGDLYGKHGMGRT
ncbi:hypothetical protein [Nocardia sp. NPDC057030]|uniref:hypothetical protein n=1 Tax=unclassified Nocardia TaxID=2637762 RepID=UPI0036416F16